MGRIVKQRLGLTAVAFFAVLIIVITVWHLLPTRSYASESFAAKPQLVLISQVYGESGVRSQILNIHQESKIKGLLYFLNARYLVLEKGAIFSALEAPPIEYYITLRYKDASENQSIIINLPDHYIENIKTGTGYDIANSPDYGDYSKFMNFLKTLF